MKLKQLGWVTRAGVGIGVLASAAALALGAPAVAAASTTTTSTSATVVKTQIRAPVGKILITVTGKSLYILPTGTCTTTSCLQAWPPLLMPKGDTTPLGAKCLATAKFGTAPQVTYHNKRLYTFVGDSGRSLNGNGVSGFKAAVLTSTCP